MKRFAIAMAAASLAFAGQGAEAKPVKCAKAVSKRCRKLPARPSITHPSVPMVGVDPFAAAPAPAPIPDVPAPNPAPAPAPTPAPARLGVVAREWSLTLSRTTLAAGPASVELQNFGEDAHNLRVERVDASGPPLDLPLAESGERQKATGTLAAGTYKVYCTLPGHDAQGMHAQLVVR
jgi:plastocyanin